MAIPNNVLAFAQDKSFYESFADYYNQYLSRQGKKNVEFASVDSDGKPISFDEKEALINAAFKREILKHAGVANFDAFPEAQWANHPTIRWATFATVSALIDMILPQTIIESMGMYTDVRVGGFGDNFIFHVTPRDLFSVSKAGRSKRTAEMVKQSHGDVTVTPEPREMTVYVSLYRVLAGKESLAEFVAKAIRSLETQMTVDVYNTFATAMAALPASPANTALRVSGYSQADLVDLATKVTAFNAGQKAIVMGTRKALLNVLPDDANYRYMLESEYVKLGYVRTINNYDVMPLEQVADWENPFALKLDDTKLWIVSPSSQKLVKLCLEGSTLSNTTAPFDNADLTQSTTLTKSYGQAIATNSVAATIELS